MEGERGGERVAERECVVGERGAEREKGRVGEGERRVVDMDRERERDGKNEREG
jgi:hypothetical protein